MGAEHRLYNVQPGGVPLAANQSGVEWVSAVKAFLASPSLSGATGAIMAGWQGLVEGTPENVIVSLCVLCGAAGLDSIFGVRRAVKEGKFTFRGLLKPLDKAFVYLGICAVALLIGAEVNIHYTILLGATWALTIREFGSVLNHLDAITDGALSVKGGALEGLMTFLESLREAKRQQQWNPVSKTPPAGQETGPQENVQKAVR